MTARRWLVVGGATVALGTLLALVRKRASLGEAHEGAAGRWRCVTVDRDPADLEEDGPAFAPLRELVEEGLPLDVRTRPAPGGRGTEIAARLEGGDPGGPGLLGADVRGSVREALRRTKQLLEVGEVMLLDPKPEGHRRATPAGIFEDLVVGRSMRQGVL